MEVKYPKYKTIYSWKRIGVIYHNFDELYEVYIKTMNCWHCNKEFNSTFDRCLDHNHETGAFRAIVCHKCNCKDSYLKNPNGFDIKKYKQEYSKRRTICLCGIEYAINDKGRHLNSPKHLKNMDKYMNNID